MVKKNALGKGLGALIESNETLQRSSASADSSRKMNGVAEVEVNLIDANPYQPRTIFDEEALAELADSIKEIGIIQPVTLRKTAEGRFQLISGERRLRASKLAELQKIPAYIREANDENMLAMALVENIQREDLDAIEIAISYQRLVDECNLTQESLSKRVGKKRATVANYLRLLKLPAEIQLGIRDNKVSMGHARSLIGIDDPRIQLNAYNQILLQELSVRKTEELVRKLSEQEPEAEATPRTAQTPETPPQRDYDSLKNHLKNHFQTNVEFSRNHTGNGKIVIPFKTDEELERIIAIFDKLNT